MGAEERELVANSTVVSALALDDPSLFFNRELSHLEFNRRVLDLAKDQRLPLLERLRFLTILSRNLDEFFEVRVAGVKQRVALDLPLATPDQLTPQEVLRRVDTVAHGLIAEQYVVLNEDILPSLAREGIRLIKRQDWTPDQRDWLHSYFKKLVLPLLSPVGLDPSHPFPRVQNKSLNFVVELKGKDAFGRESGVAVLKVPRTLPRVIALGSEVSTGPHDFVLISSLVHAFCADLFPGMKVSRASQFRVTRNSDMWVDEEEIDDLLTALKGELHGRNFGHAVRLEVPDTCKGGVRRLLMDKHGLTDADLYQVEGPVNLHRLDMLYGLVDRPDLKFQPFSPSTPEGMSGKEPIFTAIAQKDILLHHPYQSFGLVGDMLMTAAEDPDVLAVKMTLYRTGADSGLVDALIAAARAGKEVTAVVELRARFDEAANIRLATRLQDAGATVVYGVVGHKCHAKMLLVVRREAGRLRRYAHIGTGNYHARNARQYTDFGLLTADPRVCSDVHKLFLHITGRGKARKLDVVEQSPFFLAERLIERIDAEIGAAEAGQPARIQAKLNALTDPSMIQALYRASQAGVTVDLVVRGACRLRPGVAGISENIRVRSILGRFLEHHRVYYFHAGGEEVVYIGSADWMERNLSRRVEVGLPVFDKELKARLVEEGLDVYWRDNVQAWELNSDGRYTRVSSQGPPTIAQVELLEQLADYSKASV